MGDDGKVRVPMAEDTHERLKNYKHGNEDWDDCLNRLMNELTEASKEVRRLADEVESMEEGVRLGEGYEEIAEKIGEAMAVLDPDDIATAAERGAARAIEDASGVSY